MHAPKLCQEIKVKRYIIFWVSRVSDFDLLENQIIFFYFDISIICILINYD